MNLQAILSNACAQKIILPGMMGKIKNFAKNVRKFDQTCVVCSSDANYFIFFSKSRKAAKR